MIYFINPYKIIHYYKHGNYCIKQDKVDNNKSKEDYDNIIDIDNGVIIPSHKLFLSNHYNVNYPDHIKRKSSAIYKRTHHELCHIRDMPCFICGKTQKKDNI